MASFVPTVFKEFSPELCTVVPVADETEPSAEAETDTFDKPATVFADKTELSEAVRTFVCNSEPSSARRALSVVNSEIAQKKHRTYLVPRRRCKKSAHTSSFFIANPPSFRRCPYKTGTDAHCFETHKRQPQPPKNSAVESCFCAFSSFLLFQRRCTKNVRNCCMYGCPLVRVKTPTP